MARIWKSASMAGVSRTRFTCTSSAVAPARSKAKTVSPSQLIPAVRSTKVLGFIATIISPLPFEFIPPSPPRVRRSWGIEDVELVLAAQNVVFDSADVVIGDAVEAVAAVYGVGGVAVDDVDGVIAVAAAEDVGAIAADEQVVAFAADEGVVAVVAFEDVALG